jgi:hypothetical protein
MVFRTDEVCSHFKEWKLSDDKFVSCGFEDYGKFIVVCIGSESNKFHPISFDDEEIEKLRELIAAVKFAVIEREWRQKNEEVRKPRWYDVWKRFLFARWNVKSKQQQILEQNQKRRRYFVWEHFPVARWNVTSSMHFTFMLYDNNSKSIAIALEHCLKWRSRCDPSADGKFAFCVEREFLTQEEWSVFEQRADEIFAHAEKLEQIRREKNKELQQQQQQVKEFIE